MYLSIFTITITNNISSLLMKISKCSYYDIETNQNDGIGILIDIMNLSKVLFNYS